MILIPFIILFAFWMKPVGKRKLRRRVFNYRVKYARTKWHVKKYIVMDMPIAPFGLKTGDLYAAYYMPHYRVQLKRLVRCRFRSKWCYYSNWKIWRWALNEYVRPNLIPDVNEAITPFRRVTYHARKLGMVALPFMLVPIFGVYLPLTTWYMDYDTGDDSNNGTAPETPIKTLYQMFTLTNTTSDDIIYLRKGVSWASERGGNDHINPRSSFGPGTSGHEIIVDGGTWGAGDDAIIDGDLGVEGMNLAIELTNSNANFIYLKNIKVQDTVSSAVTWHGAGNHIHDITLDNIYCYHSGGNGMIGSDFDDLLITDSYVDNSYGAIGLNPGGRSTGTSTNWTFRDCRVWQDAIGAPNDGIQCHEGTDHAQGPGLYLRLYSGYWSEQSYDFTTGGIGDASYTIYILGCEAEGSRGGMIFGHEHAQDTITKAGYCYLHGVDTNANYFHLMFNAPNIRWYNGLIETESNVKRVVWADHQAADNPGPNNCRFEYNTIIVNGTVETVIGIGGTATCTLTDFVFRNNAIYCHNVVRMWDFVTQYTRMADMDNINYNRYYQESGVFDVTDYTTNNITWATWQSSGNDANSGTGSDIKLVDPDGATSGFPDDAKLQSGSPCIDAGVSISTGAYYKNIPSADILVDDMATYEMTGITEDYYGVTR